MSTWTAGYVADIDYTHGYYRELAPEMLGFAAAMAGLDRNWSPTKFTYCELGCGHGYSANIIAAAHPEAEIYATDFNPSQIAGARKLAKDGGLTNVHFYEHAFADFTAEPSLPDSFDIITLHGIYSWISAENRRHIVDFIRHKLKPGGLVYISYNTMPGWAPLMPLRHLLKDQAATRTGPITPRIDEGIALAENLIAAKAAYFVQSPAIGARVEKIKGMSRSYLAHEYMNADWTPFYFADVVKELSEAKLIFLCSAQILDSVDVVNLTAEQQTFLNAVTDPIRRQGLRDFIINQQFRRDVFVKGATLLTPGAAQAQLLDQRFALSAPRSSVQMKLNTNIGEVSLQPDSYEPVLDKFASGPATLRQLLEDKTVLALGWGKVRQALSMLVGTVQLQPCLPAQDEAKRAQRTKAFNAAVMRRAEWSNQLGFLASPVTGGGLPVDRFEQIFLSTLSQKGLDPAERAWAQLSAQGQAIIKDGKPLATPEENLAELRSRVATFTETRLPILKQLGVA